MHQRLTGTDEHVVFWTLRACAYPWELCDGLACAIVSSARMKNFGMRAGEIRVRNADVKRKLDVDEFSDSLSCDSDLYFFEGCHDNSSEAESSCVESDFQTLAQSNSNAMRARVERAQAPNMYVHNPDVQMLCRIDEFADVDVDAHSDDSFCTCNSEIC